MGESTVVGGVEEARTVNSQRPAAVIVLAAGEGKRMHSSTPKVLHRLAGRSLLGHALAAARSLSPDNLVVVVRHQRDLVAAHVTEVDPKALIADQDEIPGTGRAVACGLAALRPAGASSSARDSSSAKASSSGGVLTSAGASSSAGAASSGLASSSAGASGQAAVSGTVVVTYGDVPLLAGDTLAELVRVHHAGHAAVTVLTADVPDPAGYGRVVRDTDGAVTGIVEHRDADGAQREITEINSGIYAFDAAVLTDALGRIGSANDQGEQYLTDVLALAHADGHLVQAVRTDDLWQVEGVNDRVQLATLGAELNRRVLLGWMRAGVTVVDPSTTWVDVDVELTADVTLLPGVQLQDGTTVAAGATIGPDTTLTHCQVGPGASVVRSHGAGARIEAGAAVGPFSFLRAGTVLGEDGKIGAFVETKNAVIGAGSKVPHLTYAGDTTIGVGSNIGAATIFANYDGVHKHHTTIGDHVRVGSDTVLIAPVTIGDGAYTAAGSAISEDVPAGALGVARGRQRNVDGWVERRRPGTPSAAAAHRASK